MLLKMLSFQIMLTTGTLAVVGLDGGHEDVTVGWSYLMMLQFGTTVTLQTAAAGRITALKTQFALTFDKCHFLSARFNAQKVCVTPGVCVR